MRFVALRQWVPRRWKRTEPRKVRIRDEAVQRHLNHLPATGDVDWSSSSAPAKVRSFPFCVLSLFFLHILLSLFFLVLPILPSSLSFCSFLPMFLSFFPLLRPPSFSSTFVLIVFRLLLH